MAGAGASKSRAMMMYVASGFAMEDEIEYDGDGCVSAFESFDPGLVTVLVGKCICNEALSTVLHSSRSQGTLPRDDGMATGQ